jgi:hypothetical protein
MWSCAAERDISQLQLVQNKAEGISLRCTQRVNVSNMHVSLSWLRVEERLTTSLLVFVWGVDVFFGSKLSVQAVVTQFGHSSVQHNTCNLRFSQSPGPVQRLGNTVLNIDMTTWNSLPPQVTQASIKTYKRTPYGTTRSVKRHSHFYIFCIVLCRKGLSPFSEAWGRGRRWCSIM